MNYVLKTT